MDVVNVDDLDWSTTERDGIEFRRKRLAAATEAERLGCSLYELPPGAKSWPYHYHMDNEEAVYVLAGAGHLRTPDGIADLEAGDYAALPAGTEGGHRLVNDGDEPLRYLMVSTMRDPDVTVYPDSGKLGVYAGSAPGGDRDREVSGYYRIDDDVDYWEGETGSE